MTVLELLLNPMSTLMTTPMTTTTTTSADEHGNIASTGASTLTSYTTTTLGSIEVPEEIVAVHDSMAYVESMTDEELSKLEGLLIKKDLEFEIKDTNSGMNEFPKVFVKNNK